MPLREIPATVVDAWGKSASHDFADWLEGVLAEETTGRSEWVGVSSRLEGVDGSLIDLRADLSLLRADLETVKADVAALKADMADVKTDVAVLKTDVAVLKADMVSLKADVREVKADLKELRRDMIEGFERQSGRFDQLNYQMVQQMRWSVGVITVFGAIIAILVGIGQLAP